MTYAEIATIVKIYDKPKPKLGLSLYYTDEFPEEFFKLKHPNLSTEEFDYIKSNYINETKSVLSKPLEAIKRVFNADNYNINYIDEEIGNYFKEIDFENYFKNIYLENVIIDPDSYLTIYINPDKIEIDSNGEVKQNSRLPVKPYLVRSHNIILVSKDAFIFKVGGKAKYNFVILTKNSYSLYSLNGIKDRDITYEPIFVQTLSENIYWTQANGIKKLIDDKIVNCSYFDAALPKLQSITYNLIIRQCIEARHNFPQRWYLKQDCKTCDGGKKDFGWNEDKGCANECRECNGTGKEVRFSVLRDIEISLRENSTDPENVIPTPPAGYITPPLEPSRYLTERIKADIDTAFEFMGFKESESNVKGYETALGQMIQREMLYSYLVSRSQDIFPTVEWSANIIKSIRFSEKNGDITSSVNHSYNVISRSEAYVEFTELLKAGAPTFIIRDKLKEVYEKKGELDKFDIIDKYYLYINNEATQMQVSMNLLSRYTATLSNNVIRWVEQGISESEFDALTRAELPKELSLSNVV